MVIGEILIREIIIFWFLIIFQVETSKVSEAHFTLPQGKDAEAEYYFDSTLEDFAIKIINDTIHCQILPLKNADSYSGIISFINKTTIQTPFGTFKKLEQDEVNKEFTFNSHHQSE